MGAFHDLKPATAAHTLPLLQLGGFAEAEEAGEGEDELEAMFRWGACSLLRHTCAAPSAGEATSMPRLLRTLPLLPACLPACPPPPAPSKKKRREGKSDSEARSLVENLLAAMEVAVEEDHKAYELGAPAVAAAAASLR